jgi:hypothetical protein
LGRNIFHIATEKKKKKKFRFKLEVQQNPFQCFLKVVEAKVLYSSMPASGNESGAD